MKLFLHKWFAVMISFIVMAATAACEPYFKEVNDTPEHSFTFANSVSADGRVVVGEQVYENSPHKVSFHWTEETFTKGLWEEFGSACAVSYDGSVVAGYRTDSFEYFAVWWTKESGWHDISGLDNFKADTANGVSYDGNVIVGEGYDVETWKSSAYRWTAEDGLSLLGVLACDADSVCDEDSAANSVSADGSVVVGTSEKDAITRAFYWTAEKGMSDLGYLPGYEDSTTAMDVSADGATVVGFSKSDKLTAAFRWTSSEGMVKLEELPGETMSKAYAVSADGKVIVGSSVTGGFDDKAVIWRNGKVVDLQTLLVNQYGFNLDGWTLHAANDISADGRTIVGYGTNPFGNYSAWITYSGIRGFNRP